MKTIGEEEVGVNVELECRILEFDHTQPGGIHFLVSAVFFLNYFLFYKYIEDTMALDGG